MASPEELKKFQEEVLDPVGPTFCLAKWYRTNVRLDHGISYSCHHCKQERVNRETLAEDHKALTNTDPVKEHRQSMLDGERPIECGYCWQAEDKDEISDRVIKSYDLYKRSQGEEAKAALVQDAIDNVEATPRILEVCFDNTCNFQCSYCSPVCSSKFAEELQQFGAYPTKVKRSMPGNAPKILNREENPFTEAFWEWFPELREELIELRITGGEPLLSKQLYKVFDLLLEDDGKRIPDLAINSNFCPPPALFDKFVGYIQRLSKKVGKLKVFTSIESVGARAEYSRHGLDWELYKANTERFLEETDVTLFFMLTNNALSITSLIDMLEYYADLCRRYPGRLELSSHLVRTPAYLDIRIMPKEMLVPYYEQLRVWLDDHKDIFGPYGVVQIERAIEYMMEQAEYIDVKHRTKGISRKELQEDFVKFVDEYDRRRNLDFLGTFPEYTDFYHEVKNRINTKADLS